MTLGITPRRIGPGFLAKGRPAWNFKFTPPTADDVVILLLKTEDGPERPSRTFTLASLILGKGRCVKIFLAFASARWAFTNGAAGTQALGYPPLDELIAAFSDLGGQLLVCSTCVKSYCFIAGHEQLKPDLGPLRPNALQIGLATLAEYAMLSHIVVL